MRGSKFFLPPFLLRKSQLSLLLDSYTGLQSQSASVIFPIPSPKIICCLPTLFTPCLVSSLSLACSDSSSDLWSFTQLSVFYQFNSSLPFQR